MLVILEILCVLAIIMLVTSILYLMAIKPNSEAKIL